MVVQDCDILLDWVISILKKWMVLVHVLLLIPVVGSCHHGMARPQVADRGTSSDMEVAANKLNKQSWTADKGWSSSLAVGRGANNPSLSNSPVKKHLHAGCFLWRQNNPEVNYCPTRIAGGGVFLGVVSRRIQREMKLGTRNVRSL